MPHFDFRAELFPTWHSWLFLGFVTGILSVLLLIPTRHPKIQWTNWIFSVVSAAVYFFLFKEWTLYGNMALQVPFVILSLLGGVIWIGQLVKGWDIPALRKIKEIPTTYCSEYTWFNALTVAIILEAPAYYILQHYHDASPLWDGFIFTISMSAIYLQLRKYVQSWYLWILVDLIAVPFHFSQDRGATAILYLAYGIMCYFGWKAWQREANMLAKTQKVRDDEVMEGWYGYVKGHGAN